IYPLYILWKNYTPMNPEHTKVNEAKNSITALKSVMILFFLFFKDHSKIPEIQCVKASILASNQRIILPKNDLLETCSNFPNLEESQGTNVNEAKNEKAVAIITVTAN